MWLINFCVLCFFIQNALFSPTKKDPAIIIVGSGASAIAAATKLLKAGFNNLRILEAENRIGGRVNSVRFGDAYVDLGAQYCHGQGGNVVYDLMKDLDVLRHVEYDIHFYRSNGEKVKNETAQKIIEFSDSFGNDTINGCENVKSLGECLTIRSEAFKQSSENPKEKEILADVPDFVSCHLAAYDSPLDLNDLAIKSDYRTSSGDLYMTWNGYGFKTILEVLMQKFPDKAQQLPIDDKIMLSEKVNSISNWQNDKVTVKTESGKTFDADHVIFTASVGVLKADHKTLFNPSLPDEKVNAVNNTGFGAIGKVILHFSENWWGGNAFWAFIWTENDKKILKQKNMEWLTAFQDYEQGTKNPNVITAWASGKFIPEIETLTDEQVMEGHKYLIDKFLAPNFNMTAMPDKMIRTKWYSNPNFRGTYSYESVKGHSNGGGSFQEKLSTPLMNKDGKPSVLFAGEATHPYHFSTVHGAIESGFREADRLIELYNNK